MNYRQIKRKRDSFERFGTSVFRQALNKQIAPVIRALRDGDGEPQRFVDKQVMQNAYKQLYFVVMPEFGKAIRDEFGRALVGSKGDIIDIRQKDDDDFFEPKWEDIVSRYINISLGARITGVNEYTREIVERVIRESMANNLSIPETVKELRAKWRDISRYRATMIARTEIITASNAGSYQGALSTNIPMKRTWLATGGKRTRDTHAAAHGQTIDIRANYVVGGEVMRFPGDPNASAANVVNCRCAETYDMA